MILTQYDRKDDDSQTVYPLAISEHVLFLSVIRTFYHALDICTQDTPADRCMLTGRGLLLS